ncbi:MAG TPA: hypothetical protein VGI40_12150 [Pirellulaceae bacterium]
MLKPLLASWDAKSAPSQIRLNAYLSELISALRPLPDSDEPLFLDFRIGVSDPKTLLIACDLENYLFPLFGTKWLPPGRFALVRATKQVGVQHRIAIGTAFAQQPILTDWQHAEIDAGAGHTTKPWKQRIRDKLAANCAPLPAGPATVQIVFRCSPQRNWTTLWKPAGDCMGPILGECRNYGFNPCDDRITELDLHKAIDDDCGNDVEIHYWWRSARIGDATPEDRSRLSRPDPSAAR